ncbi:MAG: hypothetical protein KF857_07485 [Fimbriimonadaceae bacterium]|nr:hypothetical protein [Fimbriimonadaceae bacterium]
MQDKKKLLVVGALVMVLCAVGAFTLMGGGGGSSAAAKPQATTKGSEKAAEPETTVDPAQEKINKLIASMGAYGSMESRDPFAVPAEAKSAVEPPPAPPVQKPSAPAKSGRSSRPPRMEGGTAPWQLPMPNGGQLPNGNQLPAQIVPRYRVKGVLVGKKSVVVIEDSNGNQRLVPQGGQLDPTTRVTNIEKGQITVNENGKSKTLPIEEGS